MQVSYGRPDNAMERGGGNMAEGVSSLLQWWGNLGLGVFRGVGQAHHLPPAGSSSINALFLGRDQRSVAWSGQQGAAEHVEAKMSQRSSSSSSSSRK
jgi:hypothetical protein